MGIASIIFGALLDVDLEDDSESELKQDVPTRKNTIIEKGWALITIGGVILLLMPVYFMFLISREKEKNNLKLSDHVILFDEMYDGKEIELTKKGYEAYSVKKLRLEGKELHYDYSVLKYVEEQKMILITEDPENYGGCIKNGLPCIKLGQNPSIDEVIKELEALKKKL